MKHLILSPRFAARVSAVLVLSLSFLPLRAQSPAEARKEGTSIMQHWLATKAVETEMAFLKMQTLNATGSVETKKLLAVLRRAPDGASQFMVRLVEPEDLAGVTLLARKSAEGATSQYSYLPTIGRLRPLAGDAQSAPFLGSDFTYEDLLEEIPEDQIYLRRPNKFIHGAECYVVRATPKNPGSSAYAYRDLYIDTQTFDLYRIDFFGPRDEFLKYFAAYDYDSPRIAGPSTRPRRAVMTNLKGNSRTILTVVQSRINSGNITEDLFSAENIQNWSDDALESFIFDMFLEVSSPPAIGQGP